MSTKEMPGAFDGMVRAQPGEPVFTLRAHDPLASVLTHEWVDRKRKLIREAFEREEITEVKRDLELIQCREAEELAWSMDAWRKGELASQAQALEAPTPTYSGHAHDEEELAAKALYDAIKRAVALLNNAVAGATEAAEVLAPIGLSDERAVVLTMVERLKLVSSHIAPTRASFWVGEGLPEPFNLKAALVCINDVLAHMEAAGADPSR